MEPIFSAPSHPTQIYEALCYFIIFLLLMYMYWKKNAGQRQGLIFGVFLVGVFFSRFCIEFLKNNQEEFEENMILNMGQLFKYSICYIRYIPNNQVTKTPHRYRSHYL